MGIGIGCLRGLRGSLEGMQFDLYVVGISDADQVAESAVGHDAGVGDAGAIETVGPVVPLGQRLHCERDVIEPGTARIER